MTIKRYYFTSDYERCARLAFGVPLEDAFPADDIHPSIRELFVKAYEDVVSSQCPIDEIILTLQGSVNERLNVKENAVRGRPMSGAVSPGALLWVIRHFIGLIPLPLLPQYTDGKTFNWARWSQFCKQSVLRRTDAVISNTSLIKKVAGELQRLPFQNLLLFGALLNFIRALVVKKRHTTGLTKFTALCLVQYFCSSIFIRPYRSDYKEKADKLYTPFLLFVVSKWPEIERIIKEMDTEFSRETCRPLPSTGLNDYFQRGDLFTSRHFQLERVCSKPNSNSNDFRPKSTFTQTSDSGSMLSIISEESSVDNEEFLRDTGCQTDVSLTGRRKRGRFCRCCCTYGSNYDADTSLNSRGCSGLVKPEDKLVQTDSCDEFEEASSIDSVLRFSSVSSQTFASAEVVPRNKIAPAYDWLDSSSSSITRTTDGYQSGPGQKRGTKCQSEIFSPKTFITDVEYFDDDFTNSNLNLLLGEDKTVTNSSSQATGTRKKSDPKISASSSKIGWICMARQRLTGGTSTSSTQSQAVPSQEHLSHFNGKEDAKLEEKEVCSLNSQTCVERGERLSESASLTKCRRSFSLSKIKSSLDFIKVFTKRKSKSTGSSSLDAVSEIKYEKLTSPKSTIF